MAYMIEGGGSKTQSKAKRWLYEQSKLAHELLELLSDVIIDYLVMQIQAGAQIVQVFDSNAEYLNKSLYHEFGLPYLKKISEGIQKKVDDLKLERVPLVSLLFSSIFNTNNQLLKIVHFINSLQQKNRFREPHMFINVLGSFCKRRPFLFRRTGFSRL